MRKPHLSIYIFLFFLISSVQAELVENREIVPGINHYHDYYTQGPWHIHIVEIDLANPAIQIRTVKANEQLAGNEQTSAMVRRTRAAGWEIAAAINGDFYYQGGVPVNAQVIGGLLIKRPYPRSVFGITADQEPFIDIVNFEGRIVHKKVNLAINGINEERRQDHLIIFNRFFGATTLTNIWGTELIARYLEKPAVNDTFQLLVVGKDSVMQIEHGNNSIPQDGCILSGHGRISRILNRCVFIGDTLKAILALPPLAGEVNELLGGLPRIIRDGKVSVEFKEEDIRENFCTDRHPRTAVGFTQDKQKLLLFTVDGRQSGYSEGMNLYEFARYMLQWQVYQGINLDGGGSTTMVIEGKVVNSPSDEKGERAVSNALLVLYKTQ